MKKTGVDPIPLSTQVLIIGAGASGASLSKRLSDLEIPNLVLLESGVSDGSLNTNHKVVNFDDYKISNVRTVSGLGGGTQLWGGGLVEFHEQDFFHENAFGAQRLYETIENKYNEAWNFFGLTRPSVSEDVCAILPNIPNLAESIEGNSIVYGELLKVSKVGNCYRSVTIANGNGKETEIHFKKIVIACGTLGSIQLISKFQNEFKELPLNELKTGIYSHPKCPVHLKAHTNRNITNLKQADLKVSHYQHSILYNNDHRTHAIRMESKLINLIERVSNMLAKPGVAVKFSFLVDLSRIFYNWLLQNGRQFIPHNFKLYINSLLPNFDYEYDREANKVILTFNKSSIDFEDLNQTIAYEGELLQKIRPHDVTILHSHFLGGIKLVNEERTFISSTGHVLDSENLWLNGPMILNLTGYANPVLSLVALSMAVAEDMKK